LHIFKKDIAWLSSIYVVKLY